MGWERCRLASAFVAALAAGSACSHDWDDYDPRLGASASASGSTGAGGAGAAASGTGGSSAAGSGAGGPGAGAGGAGASGVVEDCATAADDDANGEANDHCALWSKRFGDALVQDGHALAVDSAGDILLAGEANGTFDLGGGALPGAGGLDMYVAKFTTAGEHVWSHAFGGPLADRGFAIAVTTANRVVVTGTFTDTIAFGPLPAQTHLSKGATDVFVLELDAAGSYLWSRSFGGSLDDTATAVAVDGAGNVFVVGNFAGAIDLGAGLIPSAGGLDGFGVALDPTGATLAGLTLGDTADDSVEGIAPTPDGGVALTGYFEGTLGLGPVTLTAGPTSGADAFVIKLDQTGTTLWGKSFGNDTSQLPQRGAFVHADSAGNLLVAGTFQGAVDFGGGLLTSKGMDDIFVVKCAPDGAHVWSKGFGNDQNEALAGLAVDGTDAVVITGALRGGTVDLGGGALTVVEPDDIFVLKLASSGQHVWSRRFGITGDQDGGDVATNQQNEVILTGFIEGTTDVGNGILTSAGADDILLAKFPP